MPFLGAYLLSDNSFTLIVVRALAGAEINQIILVNVNTHVRELQYEENEISNKRDFTLPPTQ